MSHAIAYPQFAKRDIQLVDQTGWAVRLTLWGKQAESFAADDKPIIAFKGVKVGDFGGRSLSMFSSATMTVNPDINEAHALRGWSVPVSQCLAPSRPRLTQEDEGSS